MMGEVARPDRSDMTHELGSLGVPMSGKEYFRAHGISGIAPEEVNNE